jgi:hypothetical protein
MAKSIKGGKPKSNARTKSRIHKASPNSGGGKNTLGGKSGPGLAHEKYIKAPPTGPLGGMGSGMGY